MKELLDKYLSGDDSLTPEEISKVEQRIEEDPSLMREAERIIKQKKDPVWEKNIEKGVKDYEKEQFKKQLQGLHEELIVEKKISKPQIRQFNFGKVSLRIAASIVFILGVFWLYTFMSAPDYEKLMADFNTPYTTQEFNKSVSTSEGGAGNEWEDQKTKTLELSNLFDQKKYENCIELADEYIDNKQVEGFLREVTFLKGISQKEVGDLKNAKGTLEELAKRENLISDESKWQVVLIYLEEKNYSKAKEWLLKIPDTGDYSEKKQALLDEL